MIVRCMPRSSRRSRLSVARSVPCCVVTNAVAISNGFWMTPCEPGRMKAAHSSRKKTKTRKRQFLLDDKIQRAHRLLLELAGAFAQIGKRYALDHFHDCIAG